MNLLVPRAYIDWVVPKNSDGNEIGVCNNNEIYNFYIDWLADYLYFKDIIVPENQLKSLLEFEKAGGIGSAVFWTSDDWGLLIWKIESIEDSFINGVSFGDFHNQELEMWNLLCEDEKSVYENPDEDFFTSEREYIRIGKEKIESLIVPEHIQHADIPYRPIFAKLLKNIHDKNERFKHLDYYYCNFNECASK